MGELEEALTPAMRQFAHFKKKYPDCLLMFRMGDFYETFYEDAVTASRVLGITLTSRGKGEKRAPLAGIPIRAADTYIQKLISSGIKLAIADQIEDPKTVKGRIVARDVVRVISPGTVIEEGLLSSTKNNFIVGLASRGDAFGVSCADISTGDFFCFEASCFERMATEIKKLSPSECVLPETLGVNKELIAMLENDKVFISRCDDSSFNPEQAGRLLKEHFNTASLGGFGIDKSPLLVAAAGGLLSYLQKTQKQGLSHISRLFTININDFMVLDATTIRNLEIFQSIIDKSGANTLLSTMDHTATSMGARLLRRWLARPLISVVRIKERQEGVGALVHSHMLREELRGMLKQICDLERLAAKLSYGTFTPKDAVAVSVSLKQLPGLINALKGLSAGLFKKMTEMPTLQELANAIDSTISDDPPLKTTEGGIIRPGVSAELDELRELKDSSREVLKKLEESEIARTGIKTLRLGFNQVIGYYLQVSKSLVGKVPAEYVKKQTLVGGERYITPELKTTEARILGAEERINILEYELFRGITSEIEKHTGSLQLIARRLAVLDVLGSFAHAAEKHSYCRPDVSDGSQISLKNSRHPVVEQMQPGFIPNDIVLDKNEMIILTGPNMAGKSTFMRQVCIAVILAQLGSYVPAEEAKIGVVDRVFTRVGAYDDLTHGQSTFMVEMDETANILNNATEKSLIILDEVGRGTSTFDGVAIAWAVAEYIYNKIKAKTIFATHYHVLNKMAEEFKNIKNYNIAVKEERGNIIFLRKLEQGGTDKSYGVHVAKLAGMPKEVIRRALEIQAELMEEDKMLSKLEGKRASEQFTLKKWER
jgi:DNA mismatch repair protein MutS